MRNASASFAVRPLVSGKWISTKLATLGVTFRPSLPISAVSQASQLRIVLARALLMLQVLDRGDAGGDRRRR